MAKIMLRVTASTIIVIAIALDFCGIPSPSL